MQVFDAFDVIAAQTFIVLLIASAIWFAVELSLRRKKPMGRYKRHKRGVLPAPRPECRRDWQEYAGRH